MDQAKIKYCDDSPMARLVSAGDLISDYDSMGEMEAHRGAWPRYDWGSKIGPPNEEDMHKRRS